MTFSRWSAENAAGARGCNRKRLVGRRPGMAKLHFEHRPLKRFTAFDTKLC